MIHPLTEAILSFQWEPVIIRKKLPKGVSAKSDKVVNMARRQGLPIETQTKCEALVHYDVQLKFICWFIHCNHL